MVVSAACLVVVAVVIANVVRPGISLASVDVAEASKGTLEVSVGATGTVAPFYEETLTSPIATKILEVYKKSGEQVHKGDTILRLDLSSANVNLQAEMDAVEIQKYKLEQFRTEAASEISSAASASHAAWSCTSAAIRARSAPPSCCIAAIFYWR